MGEAFGVGRGISKDVVSVLVFVDVIVAVV